jgi:phenolic acid decarboxylase
VAGQKTTPDGQPIWSVRLTAIDTGSNSSETIWVEVAGEEPRLTLDELADVHGLVFAPWVNKKGEIVRSFRAESITVLADARRAQAAA